MYYKRASITIKNKMEIYDLRNLMKKSQKFLTFKLDKLKTYMINPTATREEIEQEDIVTKPIMQRT